MKDYIIEYEIPPLRAIYRMPAGNFEDEKAARELFKEYYPHGKILKIHDIMTPKGKEEAKTPEKQIAALKTSNRKYKRNLRMLISSVRKSLDAIEMIMSKETTVERGQQTNHRL